MLRKRLLPGPSRCSPQSSESSRRCGYVEQLQSSAKTQRSEHRAAGSHIPQAASHKGRPGCKAKVDRLRAQQDVLALASAQQDLDRLILQHDPINEIEAARRTALQEQAARAEADRLAAGQ